MLLPTKKYITKIKTQQKEFVAMRKLSACPVRKPKSPHSPEKFVGNKSPPNPQLIELMVSILHENAKDTSTMN